MKPFLGINLTTHKKNEELNGDVFLVAKPDPALTQSFELSSENVEETIKKSKLPPPIQIAQWICGILGALVAAGILNSLSGEDSVTLSQAYQNASWLFWLGGGCIAVWGLLKLISIRKAKNIFESDESSRVISNLNVTSDAILADLNVPKDSEEIDILSFFYKVKDDKIKVCEKGLQIASHMNPIFHAFCDSKHLYLANLEGKYAFPLTDIKGIRSVKKTILLLSWNKDVPYNHENYKKYKLSEDNYGCIHCKGYHILELEHDGETWGVYFPCYELPVMEQLTGLTADTF